MTLAEQLIEEVVQEASVGGFAKKYKGKVADRSSHDVEYKFDDKSAAKSFRDAVMDGPGGATAPRKRGGAYFVMVSK